MVVDQSKILFVIIIDGMHSGLKTGISHEILRPVRRSFTQQRKPTLLRSYGTSKCSTRHSSPILKTWGFLAVAKTLAYRLAK